MTQADQALQDNSPQKVYLKDYAPPVFSVATVDLDIAIFDSHTKVIATLNMTREYAGKLELLGRKLELMSLTLNGQLLGEGDYLKDDERLTITHSLADCAVGETLTITSVVHIDPASNTELEGLYVAGTGKDAMFVTQCEPEGFRKITYFPDRPDVLASYTTRLEAPKRFPVLLANGNLIDSGDVDGERHFALWQDPTKKPSYLFACVAADLDVLQDYYTTSEGRRVLLEFYAEPKDIDKCHVAMQALKDAMKWDEDVYGRVYDLDRYMVVATGQFNMGAMENKGLNIFNTSCVLADAHSATDTRNFNVKSVVAHEYFHNWTGNRVTCRDWFQLCLKEGLTVYRDQCFSADFGSPSVQRIEEVGVLRATQFPEDAGPLAHPVRPDNFVEINNFYTATVYEKGAEIVRMMANFLGKDKYRRGMDVYFERHDGEAVTVEDFIAALATQDERIQEFVKWYAQPATPVLSGSASVIDGKLVINLSQRTRHVPGFEAPVALPIPVAVAVFDRDTGKLLYEETLWFNQADQEFCLDVELTGATPLVSVLRSFSAPVLLNFSYSDEELAKLVAYEIDGFNRWQAVQMLVRRYLFGELSDDKLLTDALYQAVSELKDSDPMLAARLFDIPSEKEIAASIDHDYDPQAIKEVRERLKSRIAQAFADVLTTWYDALPITTYEDTPRAVGQRALRNILLDLMPVAGIDATDRIRAQYENASCMSERFGALSVAVMHNLAIKDALSDDFYTRFSDDDLVIDSWFNLMTRSEQSTVSDLRALMARDDFDWRVPNRVRAVLGVMSNRPVLLWSKDGLELFSEAVVHLDASNPQLSARLLGGLSRWYTLSEPTKSQARAKLEAIKSQVHSSNVLEFVHQLLSA